MNKSVRGVLALLATGALVAGCSSSATPAPSQASTPVPSVAPAASSAAPAASSAAPSASPAKQDLTLSLLASQDWIRPAEQDLAKKFEAQTGIHIDYQIIPSANYFQVLNTKLNSGEGPDIFMGQSGVSDLKVTYNVEANAVDLSSEEWVTREDKGAVAQATLDGKVWGQEIWDYAGGEWVIVYNKDIFQQVGITSAPATFDELVADCDKIKAAGITPIFEPISDGWHHVLWFPEAGPRFEELEPGLTDKLNANQTTFADDANIVTALTQINTLYQKGFFGANALSAKEADTNKQMASGKYAMTVTQLSRPAGIHTDFPNIAESTFGYFPKPILDNQLQPLNAAGPTKFIWSKGSHVAEAKQFFAFLAQPDSLQSLVDNEPRFLGINFSDVKGKWSDEQQAFLTKYPAKTSVFQTAVNYVNPQWMDIGKDLVAMFTGKQTPVQVAQSVDKRRTQEATAAKDPAWQK